ncbi:flagellar type III secretion system protein FliR [Natroniella sulfidigena]|uniref:flagellar biosynthetic protein FliR n=1 Tax=Natroniella sulfidigena TaxID=723921 RepID=UPI00200A1F64|nr:flagellar biosynthetic protein FliR [Natroniella sulfidigena]MCK8816515.1 flagellar type III secretion system protein FliR [Natroniella sulfidigena]
MEQVELLTQVYRFSLMLARIIGFFVVAPIFGSEVLPRRLRIGFAVLIIFVLFPTLSWEGIEVPEQLLLAAYQLVVELFIGLVVGFLLQLTFITVQLAGIFIDRKMGFMMASVMDPLHGIQAPLIGQFKNVLATLLFLAVNAHHYQLRLLSDSFKLVPVTNFQSTPQFLRAVLRIIGDLFPLAFQIALPIMAIVFIVDLAFGLVARTVPQMNVFMLGLPTKVFVGLIILGFILPNYLSFMQELFMERFSDLYQLLNLMIERG